MRIMIFVLIFLLVGVLFLKDQRGCFAVTFEWTGPMPKIKVVTGKGYAVVWNTNPARDAIYEFISEQHKSEQRKADKK